MISIVKAQPTVDLGELYITAMFLMHMRAPARPSREEVKRGAVTNLGEIGYVPEIRTWSRETPYSPARRVIELMAVQRNSAISETVVKVSGGYQFHLLNECNAPGGIRFFQRPGMMAAPDWVMNIVSLICERP